MKARNRLKLISIEKWDGVTEKEELLQCTESKNCPHMQHNCNCTIVQLYWDPLINRPRRDDFNLTLISRLPFLLGVSSDELFIWFMALFIWHELFQIIPYLTIFAFKHVCLNNVGPNENPGSNLSPIMCIVLKHLHKNFHLQAILAV